MVLKIWYSTFFSVVNALIVIYEIAIKKKYKNQKIKELLGLPCQNLQEPSKSTYNIAIQKNNSGINIECTCKLYYQDKRR